MKNYILIFIAIISAIINVACTEQNNADNFVGTYSVNTVQNVTWGNASATLTDHGFFRITKISASRVQVSGYFNTTGKVVGSNIYLKSYTDSDANGSLTISFGAGTLNGNVLTISSIQSGQLAENGIFYPFHSTGKHTCVKQ
jgi:hypothetical protein